MTLHDNAQRSRADLHAPATQLVPDREAYLGQGRHDVGRRISDDQVEFFVDGDVASALQRAFSMQMQEFVALHDVGGSASLRLLNNLASAGGGRVQRLSVRHQGHGVALAVLQFVEMPLSDGRPVRVYSTDVNADSQARSHIGRVLLGFSRLGVLLVGELPPHALATQLAPLHSALLAGPWPNRDLLMLPLGPGGALATQAALLAADSTVAVHVTPHAGQPELAWSYIGGAWNRLRGRRASDGALPTQLALAVPKAAVPQSEAPTLLMGLDPVPAAPPAPARPAPAARAPVPAPAPAPAPVPAPAPASVSVSVSVSAPASAAPQPPAPRPGWHAVAERCLLVKGCIACCVFDVPAMQPLGFASHGHGPNPLRLAQQGTALLEHGNDMAAALGMGAEGAEASISTSSHHALVRRLPGHPGIAAHVLLSSTSNLTLARLQLERVVLQPEPSPPTRQKL